MIRKALLLILVSSCAFAEDAARECPSNPALPDYPLIARAARVEGTVELQISVDQKGNAKASPAGGHPMLVQPSMDTVERWKFAGSAPRSFKMKFIYRIDNNAKPQDLCARSRLLVDFPNVEIWAAPVPLNTNASQKK